MNYNELIGDRDIELAFHLTSNHESRGQKRYMMQAWNAGMGWLDTIVDGDTQNEVVRKAVDFWDNPDKWMTDQRTKVRLVVNRLFI